jgi:hypothetical protein
MEFKSYFLTESAASNRPEDSSPYGISPSTTCKGRSGQRRPHRDSPTCWKVRGMNPDMCKGFFLQNGHYGSAAKAAPCSTGTVFLSEEQSCRLVKLITHLHLLPRLRMNGAVPLLPRHVFMEWTETT